MSYSSRCFIGVHVSDEHRAPREEHLTSQGEVQARGGRSGCRRETEGAVDTSQTNYMRGRAYEFRTRARPHPPLQMLATS